MNIEIIKLDNMGRGIGYINDKIVFVNNTLPGEIVNIKVIKEKKKYSIANVVKYINKSSNRIKPVCPYYDKCGGCNLQHFNYIDYINYKKNNLMDIINRYTDIMVDPIVITNDIDYFYRNKIELKIVNKKWGYYNEITHDFVSINKCYLASKVINNLIDNKDLFNINNGIIIIRSNYKDELLISIKSSEDNIDIEKLISIFKISGIILNDEVIYGNDYFIEKINNISFKVNYKSFFQVNRNILSKVFNILNKEIAGNNLLDLYCGVGVLGLSVADKFNNIVGIEINEKSINDAKYNSKLNNIDNTKYYVGDTKKVLEEVNIKFDTIIIDPPRSGMDKKTIDYVMNSNSNNILYMSCDEITLSRDLNLLKDKYEIRKIYLLDMFSYTKHVECVSVLHRKSVEK